MTIVHKKGIPLDGRNPALMIGYGAYGHNVEASFHTEYLELLRRNWVIALAHVRGGSELGVRWYHEGKQLSKRNSFHDFIACAEHLIAQGYTCSQRLTAMGSSAGGLLLGALLNMRPDLFRAMIVKVPFVDVVTTMLDPALPLTIHEYDEWGNPSKSEEILDYLSSYDPYLNIESQEKRTSLLVTGSYRRRALYKA